MTSLPTVMKALVIEEPGRIAVKDHPVPSIAEDEVLIKTVAVALNPTDWKHVFTPTAVKGSVVGCDVSGIVVQVGQNVPDVKLGDHVTTIAHGATYPDEGAFAEYVKSPAELLFKVPENMLTFEQSSTFGVAFLTPVQMFYHPKHLALVEPPRKVQSDEWLLIYGGSSAVGQYAIQLAHLSGYKIVTTASPRNHDLVRSLGADVVFDYRDPDVVTKIKGATGDSIRVAFDTISETDSQRIAAASISPEGGKLGVILRPQPEAIGRKDVEVILTLLYTAQGRPLDYGPNIHFPAKPEDRAQIAAFLKKAPQLVKDGAVRPITIKLWDGGLAAIADGFQYMRDGKVSAEKIVYRL